MLTQRTARRRPNVSFKMSRVGRFDFYGRPLDEITSFQVGCYGRSFRSITIDDVNELKEMFHMNIKPEQRFGLKGTNPEIGVVFAKLKKTIHFNICVTAHPYTFSGIFEVPKEVNRIIMSFLKVHIEFTLILSCDKDYPYRPLKWEVSVPRKNSDDVKKCLFFAAERENKQFARDWSAVWIPQKILMVMLMRLKRDLKFFVDTREHSLHLRS